MISALSMWASFGTLQLIIASWKDFKNNMKVDDRHNWLMMGISIALLTHIPRGLWYILGLALFMPMFWVLMRKIKAIGEGDINSISWILFGFGIINIYYAAWFGIAFIVVTCLYAILRFWAIPFGINTLKLNLDYMPNKPLPFYPVILLAFFITNILLGIYN